MDAPVHRPTDEQTAICDLIRDTDSNLVINALAGTGKTTTLEMVQNASARRPILYLAFNKRIAEEAEKKFASTTTVRTINGLGHRIWAKVHARNLKLDPKKSQTLLREIIKDMPRAAQPEIWDCFWNVIEGVALAKALGYIPDGKYPATRRLTTREVFHASLSESPDSLTADLIDAVLTLSIKTAYEGFIDFNDQIYMPALFGGTYPRFPLVLADEVQDFNPCNHEMLHKLVTNRLCAVGDPWQSIYAFRGAKQGGMEEITSAFAATTCNLSVSFRCPEAIVKAVHWRVPHFRWALPGGRVEVLDKLSHEEIPDDCAIICRNNAPLYRVALHLLSAKRSVSVAGSDLGPKVVGILRKMGPEGMSQASLLSAIEDWRAERLAKSSTTANDTADCMKVFAAFGQTLDQAIIYAEHLFKQKGSIRLLTGHKAKGLEWNRVYHLDPWLIHDDRGDQEQNLRYVISTRTKQELFEVNSKDIQW